MVWSEISFVYGYKLTRGAMIEMFRDHAVKKLNKYYNAEKQVGGRECVHFEKLINAYGSISNINFDEAVGTHSFEIIEDEYGFFYRMIRSSKKFGLPEGVELFKWNCCAADKVPYIIIGVCTDFYLNICNERLISLAELNRTLTIDSQHYKEKLDSISRLQQFISDPPDIYLIPNDCSSCT